MMGTYRDRAAILRKETDTIRPLYRPEWSRALGMDMAAAVVLQQVFFWHEWAKAKGYQDFYKFKEPCGNELYRPGDSWTEELAIRRTKFDNALKKIATKMSRAEWESGTVQHTKPVEWWTDRGGLSRFRLNEENMNAIWEDAYREDAEEEEGPDFAKSGNLLSGNQVTNSRESRKPDSPERRDNPETTTRDNQGEKSKHERQNQPAAQSEVFFGGNRVGSFTGDIQELEEQVESIVFAGKDEGDTHLHFPDVFGYVLDEQWKYYADKGYHDSTRNRFESLLGFFRKRYENREARFYWTDFNAWQIRDMIQEEFDLPNYLPRSGKSKDQLKERDEIQTLFRMLGNRLDKAKKYLHWLGQSMADPGNYSVRFPVTMQKVLAEDNLQAYVQTCP